MKILISPSGNVRCLYAEDIDLRSLGKPTIVRASHVEPTPSGEWIADLSPMHGPLLGPFPFRTQALAAEVAWLEQEWLERDRLEAERDGGIAH